MTVKHVSYKGCFFALIPVLKWKVSRHSPAIIKMKSRARSVARMSVIHELGALSFDHVNGRGQHLAFRPPLVSWSPYLSNQGNVLFLWSAQVLDEFVIMWPSESLVIFLTCLWLLDYFMLNMNRRDSSVVCLFRFVAQLKKEVDL